MLSNKGVTGGCLHLAFWLKLMGQSLTAVLNPGRARATFLTMDVLVTSVGGMKECGGDVLCLEGNSSFRIELVN